MTGIKFTIGPDDMGNSCSGPGRSCRIYAVLGRIRTLADKLLRTCGMILRFLGKLRVTAGEPNHFTWISADRHVGWKCALFSGHDENTGTTRVSKGRSSVLPFLNLLSRPCV